MIVYATGDILQSRADVLVNPINLDGVMGKGLAKQFRDKYPDMYAQYKLLCGRKYIKIGEPWWFNLETQYVMCFPTKIHWKNPSRLTYIDYGLKYFSENYKAYPVKTIAWPMLGCGEGGLKWAQVEPLMIKYLEPLDIVSTLYVENINGY